MARTGTTTALIAIGSLLLLSACGGASPAPARTATPAPATATPTPVPTLAPTDTPVPLTDTPLPAATDTPMPPPAPTDTPTPTPASLAPKPAPAPAQVSETRVIYHDTMYQDGAGTYEEGVLPWLDLLVQLGTAWYGPERAPDDTIDALPLPDGYRWECDGGFGCHANGEAWWAGSANGGTAQLVGPSGGVLAELSLQVAFRESGGDKRPSQPPILPTPGCG